MTAPLCSIVIPAHNAAGTIAAGLQALESQTMPRHRYEIIVVDDGSTDGTAEVVRRLMQRQGVGDTPQQSAKVTEHDEGGRTTDDRRPTTDDRRPTTDDRRPTTDEGSSSVLRPSSPAVKLLRQPHQGPAAARNAGAQAARGDLILFLDADCTPAHDWVERMTRALQRDGVAGVSGRVRTRQRGLIPRFVQAEYDARYERIAQRPDIDFISSATAGYRRQAFAAVGGFATELGGAEDVDLSFRLSEAGYRLVFEPRAVVYHPHPESLLAYARRKFTYAYWRARVYGRHPQKVAADSRTPLSQKLQIALMPLIGLGLGAGFLWPAAWRLAAALMGGFLLTTLPFAIHAGRRDPPVGLIAPPVILVSAIAAAAGLTSGVLHRQLIKRTFGIVRS